MQIVKHKDVLDPNSLLIHMALERDAKYGLQMRVIDDAIVFEPKDFKQDKNLKLPHNDYEVVYYKDDETVEDFRR